MYVSRDVLLKTTRVLCGVCATISTGVEGDGEEACSEGSGNAPQARNGGSRRRGGSEFSQSEHRLLAKGRFDHVFFVPNFQLPEKFPV